MTATKIVGTDADVARGIARANAMRIADGKAPRTRHSGPVLDMLADAGFGFTHRRQIAKRILDPLADAQVISRNQALAPLGLRAESVDVTVTDRTRNANGDYNTVTSRVVVLVSGNTDPTLIAAQIVAATHPDGMVLSTTVLI